MSLMDSILLRLPCPTCLAYLTWMVCEIGGKWPYCNCFVWWYFQDLFTAIWVHYMDSNKTAGEEARRQLHKNAASNIEQVLAATPHKTPTVRPPASYTENYSSQTNQTRRTLLEKQGRTHKRCTPMDPHTWLCKSRTTSTNIHSAAMWGYGMLSWRPA